MRALISGYYGFGNLGDEALLETIVLQVRARFPRLEIEVLSAAPEQTATRLRVEATPRWNRRAVRAAIGRADVVLSGGGGLLQNATSTRSLLYYAWILREAVAAGRRTMIFAQSIGPLDRWGRLLVRFLCRGVDRATVRDARSSELLRSLLPGTPVERTADPVFLYDLPDEPIDLSSEGLGASAGAYAVVSVRKSPGFETGVKMLARVVDRLAAEHDLRVVFLPFGGVGDAEASTRVIRECASAPMLLPESSLERTAAVVRGARVTIGMRLHALIFAARFAVPFLAIPYDPKVASLCADLDYPLEALWRPSEKPPAPAWVDALVDRLMSQSEGLAEHLRERSNALRASAERNFEVLGELIHES